MTHAVFSFIGQVLTGRVSADLIDVLNPPCSDLQPGCGEGSANIFAFTLPNLAVLMLEIATALSVFFIVWAGVQMVLSMGDEGKISKQKATIFFSLIGLFVAICSQLAVSWIVTQDWNDQVSTLPINVISAAVEVLLTIFNGLFGIAIVYYALRMVMASGDSGGFNTARTGITWAIVGAIFVNLANALVQGVTSYFGL